MTSSNQNMSLLKPTYTNTTNQNNFSTSSEYKNKRKCPTFASSFSKSLLRLDNIQQSLQMIKISLKKQTDRRNKLKKLLERYVSIYAQEKKHLKNIKAFIIEMKDATAACKLRLLYDPIIIVENRIKVSTRQFFCTLLNTFYKTYSQNQENNKIIKNLNSTLSFLIKGISFNEDKIFMMQKTHINEQVQLQSDLLTQKNRLKQQLVKKKQIVKQFQSVQVVYESAKQKNLRQKDKIQQLRNKLLELNQQCWSLEQNIASQEDIKNKYKDKIDAEMLYKNKLTNQLSLVTKNTGIKHIQSNKLLKKLYQSKVDGLSKQLQRSNSNRKQNRTIGEITKQHIKFSVQIEFSNLRD